jgi:3-oxoadipate enol-lactonase
VIETPLGTGPAVIEIGGRVSLPRTLLREIVDVPAFAVPEGRWLDLPGRGRTWLTDLPGPTTDAPAIVLLHAVGCTGLLTWFPAVERLAERYRVVVFDQRWHGRGIVSEHFSLRDCADDVAAIADALDLQAPVVAGYSMGSIIAQRVWRQHPERLGGLVLAATTDHFRTTGSERVFHQGMELGMGALRTLSRSKAVSAAGRLATDLLDPSDMHEWALAQWRSTSGWSVGQAVAALGRHHSTPWLAQIDVPTAVVVTTKDRVIAADRQRAIAARIPGATVHEAPCGHAGCVLQADAFVPAFLEAVDVTMGRRASRLAVG